MLVYAYVSGEKKAAVLARDAHVHSGPSLKKKEKESVSLYCAKKRGDEGRHQFGLSKTRGLTAGQGGSKATRNQCVMY